MLRHMASPMNRASYKDGVYHLHHRKFSSEKWFLEQVRPHIIRGHIYTGNRCDSCGSSFRPWYIQNRRWLTIGRRWNKKQLCIQCFWNLAK